MNLRDQYGSEHLDNIFIFVMRSYLRSQHSGIPTIEYPRVKHDSDHAIADDYLLKAVILVIDGQPPEIIDAILEAEYQSILVQNNLSANQILELHIIRLIVPPVLQQRNIDALEAYTNLWRDDANIYAQRTFYPNLSDQERERLHVNHFLPPKSMWHLDDF